jgi:hypothetical protein
MWVIESLSFQLCRGKIMSGMRTVIGIVAVVAAGLLFGGSMLSAQEPSAAPEQQRAAASNQTPSTTIVITMTMEAGSSYWKPYLGAERTVHVGMGHISPFGEGSYACGIGFPEQKALPKPDYFNATWQSTYKTDLFCVYSLPQGKIYTWDGIGGSLISETKSVNRSDFLINVVVGGTGIFENATGIWLGKTVGAGAMKEVAPKQSLPDVIVKSMEGYITIPKELKEYQIPEAQSSGR